MAQSSQELHTLTITFVLRRESGKISPNHKSISIWKVLAKGNPISQMGCHWLYQPHSRADMGFLWLIIVCVSAQLFFCLEIFVFFDIFGLFFSVCLLLFSYFALSSWFGLFLRHQAR